MWFSSLKDWVITNWKLSGGSLKDHNLLLKHVFPFIPHINYLKDSREWEFSNFLCLHPLLGYKEQLIDKQKEINTIWNFGKFLTQHYRDPK